MKWAFVIIGLLLLIIGLQSYLSNWGLPSSLADIFSKIPTFGLNNWIFVAVGAIVLLYGFKRG